jgi:hypothetical protein
MDLNLFEPPADEARKAAIKQISQFTEDRYLHQTVVQKDGEDVFYEDLKLALDAEASDPRGEWRVHFHVPIYLQEFGRLRSTQEQIAQFISAAPAHTTCQHYEVETYAWGVLPPDLKQPELADGIAEELKWFEGLRDAANDQ